MSVKSILVVHKRTAYQRFCEDERDPRILQLLSEDHFTIQDLRREHQEYREALDRVSKTLDQLKVNSRFVKRTDVTEIRGHDLIISLGGDGSFLAVSHLVRDTPMLGVNASPSQSAGVFCAATAKTFRAVMAEYMEGTLEATSLNRIGLVLNGHTLIEPVLNEALICGQIPAATARYVVEIGRKKEHHKSSGLWVGPAAGSTGVLHTAGAAVLPIDSKKVQWAVREPYVLPNQKLTLLGGDVPPRGGMRIHSKMRNGMVYIDGVGVRYRFGFGDELVIVPEYQPLVVYGLARRAAGAGPGSKVAAKAKAGITSPPQASAKAKVAAKAETAMVKAVKAKAKPAAKAKPVKAKAKPVKAKAKPAAKAKPVKAKAKPVKAKAKPAKAKAKR